MSALKLISLLSTATLLGLIITTPAEANRFCYPYPDGGPGGYNRITHLCNPLHMIGRDPGPPYHKEVRRGPTGVKGRVLPHQSRQRDAFTASPQR
jgi:hypothetical protein